jgi:gentisate 1,2-dioxygenase
LHEHVNVSPRDAAILFSIQDRPVLEALGLYREEALSEGSGHQKVGSTFKA